MEPPSSPIDPEDQQTQEEKSKAEIQGESAEPFGNEAFAEVKYRTLEWWRCGIVAIASNISLGILSLPSAVASLGIVAAVLVIVGMGIITTYTGYVFGQFKLRHPHVHSIADAGEVLMGPIGREILGTALLIYLIMVMGGHILAFTVMMNTITNHGTCSIIFGVIGLVLSLVLSLPRTFKNMSWLSLCSFISIFAAVMVTMIAIGIHRPGYNEVDVTVSTSLYKGFLPVMDIVFAYAAHPGYFSLISEMKTPTDWPKTLGMLQIVNVILYTVTALVIYRFGGRNVASPALGSAGPLMAKIAYGIAIPTILIAGVLNGHLACKYIYVRIFRGTDHMHQRSLLATGTWLLLGLVFWTIAWVVAESIPVFNNLLSLISALFGSWFSYGLSGFFWLSMNRGQWFSSHRKTCLTILNFSTIGIAACLCGLGLYASGRAIHVDPSGRSFSCANDLYS